MDIQDLLGNLQGAEPPEEVRKLLEILMRARKSAEAHHTLVQLNEQAMNMVVALIPPHLFNKTDSEEVQLAIDALNSAVELLDVVDGAIDPQVLSDLIKDIEEKTNKHNENVKDAEKELNANRAISDLTKDLNLN